VIFSSGRNKGANTNVNNGTELLRMDAIPEEIYFSLQATNAKGNAAFSRPTTRKIPRYCQGKGFIRLARITTPNANEANNDLYITRLNGPISRKPNLTHMNVDPHINPIKINLNQSFPVKDASRKLLDFFGSRKRLYQLPVMIIVA
jgi:hypothetical protein